MGIGVIFLLEFSVKIIGMGFILGEGSYLKDGWNILDFIVVITGIQFFISLASGGGGGSSSGSVLRTVRLLRPLRTLNKIRGLKVIVKSFIYSLPGISDVVIFLLFVMCVLGTLGLHAFSGKYATRCRFD